MNLLAIIPARGNSKRLARKNFLLLNGKSLLQRAILCAKETGIFYEIIVTSEDQEACKIAWDLGVSFHSRNSLLSDDKVETAAVVFDVLAQTQYRYEAFCILNPTSALRTPESLRNLYEEFLSAGGKCLMTVADKTLAVLASIGHCEEIPHDGTAIFCNTLEFLKTLDFSKIEEGLMQLVEPSIDINTLEDFQRAEMILKEREK